MSTEILVSVVVIGLNEGEHLRDCFQSIRSMETIDGGVQCIYVDSGSSDDSVAIARAHGFHVLEISREKASAARARNAGWRYASGQYVLFLDGDMTIEPEFVRDAIPSFRDPKLAVAFGRRRELKPYQSWYNLVMDMDSQGRSGVVEACGGDAFIRRLALEEVDGYDDSLPTGEEPDLCRRLRGRGYLVKKLDMPMSTHDLAMVSFSEYWTRTMRTGYGYAQLADRYRHSSEPYWSRESRHNVIKGTSLAIVLVLGLGLSFLFGVVSIAVVATVLMAMTLISAYRSRWRSTKWKDLACYGLHCQVMHLPILTGQLRYWLKK